MKPSSSRKKPARTPRRRTTSDGAAILRRLDGKDAAMRALIAREELSARLAAMIYDARERAGLTQAQLAKLVGTTQSVISRLEDADYDGHLLAMLQRIGEALCQRLVIEYRPTGRKGAKAA